MYGKISSIAKSGATINYMYDASGNRIMKYTNADTTVYVRDASGNVMSVYSKKPGYSLVQSETHVYGSSRLGIANQHMSPDTLLGLNGGFGNAFKSTFARGEKFFELGNHLGNVLVTVSDKKIGVDNNADGLIDYYTADVITAQDYYPFGKIQPGRQYGIVPRYTFNGKEYDKETRWQDYGMRIYNEDLGRFSSVDPLYKLYPELTPYQFASNSPIANLDLDGGEAKYFGIETVKTYDGKGKLIKEEANEIEDKNREAGWFVNGALFRSSGALGSGTLFTYIQVTKTLKDDGTENILIEDGGALYVLSENDKGRGGLYFVSSSGGYGHANGSLSGDDAIPINLDLLVSAVGGFPKGNSSPNALPWEYSGNEVNKLAKLPQLLRSDKSFLEKVDKLLGGLKGLVSAEKSGEKAGKAIDVYLSKETLYNNDKSKSGGLQFIQCELCQQMRKVGTSKNLNPLKDKKDTANMGITPNNTQKLSVEDFHSQE